MIPYPAYKSTNLPWLPKIPKHWDVVRAKNLFTRMNRPVSVDDEVITCFRDGEVTLRKKRRLEGFTESLKEIGYQGICPGDLVIHQMDAFAGAIGVSDSKGKGTPVYICLQPKGNISNWYYAYLLRYMAKSGYIKALYRGIRERSSDFRWETMCKLDFPMPATAEQEQIVRYLDSMTAKINMLIRAKKKQIALLQEQRQAIINNAVTRGLDPNAEMKDSGIDWLGKIPKHWNVCKVKHLCSMQAGDNLTADVIQETGEYPVYGANGRRGFYHAYNLNNNCLLVGRQGALCGNVHIVSGKIWATDHAVVTVPTKRTHVSYLYYLLLAMNLNQYALETAAQPGLSVSVIQNLPTLLVPLDEQQEIASFLDKQTAIIDAAIDKMKASITALNEYKNSLISSVVTGQTDVRNIPVENVIPDDLIAEDDPTTEIEEEFSNESEE